MTAEYNKSQKWKKKFKKWKNEKEK